MKRLLKFVVLALVVGGVIGVALASAKTIYGCEIVESPTADHHTSCPRADLSLTDLRTADLRFANLSRAHLYHTDLFFADLSNASLDGADLSLADLRHATLSGANLSRARLLDAHVEGAKLRTADLSDATLSHAHMQGDYLTSADLTGARMVQVDLSRADLRNANLRGADLAYANLSSADLTGANLTGAAFDSSTKFCSTRMPDGSINDRDCRPGPARPPAASKSRTFVLAAATTKTFDVGYPSALKYKHATYFCDARVSGPGKRYVKIISSRSARGGTICRVRARNNAKLPSLDTTAKIKVTATTVH